MEAFDSLREAYRTKESVRQLCNEVGITSAAVEGAPMKQPYDDKLDIEGSALRSYFAIGRDSDEDLISLFGVEKEGAKSLPKWIRECREQVRQMAVLPMGSGPGTPAHMMHGGYMKDFAHLPYKPRRPDAQEVEQAQDLMKRVKELRDMMKYTEKPIVVACKRCGQGGVKLLQCGGCGMVKYCSKDCQRDDWLNHKVQCKFVTDKIAKKG